MSQREFYDIVHEGKNLRLPRVTTILKVLDKPALLWWAAAQERRAMQAALEEACTTPGAVSPQDVYDRTLKSLVGKRAWVRAKDEAADIGTQAHELIRWHTHRLLGYDPGPEPAVVDPALRCVLAWLDWCREVDFTPLHAERVIYCARCGFAGTVDVVAKIAGVVTLADYKSSKAVWPEALVQVNYYRHAARTLGIEVARAMVIRLPKYEDHPPLEAVTAPVLPLHELHALLTTWRLTRRLNGDELGDVPNGERCA